MQITDSMMTNQFLYNLNQVESRMMHYQNEMTSGKSLNRPSDNPLAVAEDMQDNEQLTQLQAYSQTIQSGLAWMNTTNTALTSMTSVLQSIRSTVLNASNTPDTNPQTVDGFRQTLLSDVNNLYQLADTQVGNSYIFGGYDTETAPSSALQTTNMTTTLTATSSSAPLVLPQGANVTVATSASQINIPILAGSTLAQIVSQINNQAGGLGVTAALNSTGTQLVFSYAPTTSTTNSALSITSNFFSVHQGTLDKNTSATGAINYQVSNATSETVNVTANALFRSPNTNGVSLRSTLQNILNDVNNPSRLETDL
ncbi:MAG: hypothetical protein OWT27_08650, partial [Firmicutes bacterium]|nr:hypothetical protein [Bacillota bacterium]